MSAASPDDLSVAGAYFDRFVEAFATFDGERVADLIAPPFVALSSEGTQSSLSQRSDVARYYQEALDGYHAIGCRHCRWSDLSVRSMGASALLAAVTWDLLREDGAVAVRWRQSYALNLFQLDKPRAFAAVSHAEE